MLKLGLISKTACGYDLGVDCTVTSSIGANIVHLTFVKYEKNCELAYKILKECVNLKILNLNHIDNLKAAPIHVAIRKKQYQALRDCVQINSEHKK
jgi:hypothetical protein